MINYCYEFMHELEYFLHLPPCEENMRIAKRQGKEQFLLIHPETESLLPDSIPDISRSEDIAPALS